MFGDPLQIQQLEHQFSAITTMTETDKLSVILHTQGFNNAPDIRHQQDLRDGIATLSLLNPTGQLPNIAQFIQKFQQHFEGETLPLLLALDPEGGIGYQ